MVYIDYVNSEAGPFLIADASAARIWNGSDLDGGDYKRACELLQNTDAALILIGDEKAIIWNRGAGTADVFIFDERHLVIVGTWIDDTQARDELDVVTSLASLPLNQPVNFGSITVKSGILAILWAPESGTCITKLNVLSSERPAGPMATESSGLLVKLPIGHYDCEYDEVENDGNTAVRCHLTWMPTNAASMLRSAR